MLRAAASRERMRRIAGRLAAAAVVVAGALPLVVSRPAPFTDWPNHLARVFIGVSLLRGDPFWAQFYTLNPSPVPNAALDVGIGALAWAGLSVDTAALCFLLFAYAVFVAGFCRLARAFGASGAGTPMLGALLFLTGPLMFGLVNYVLGIGLAMLAVAAWMTGAGGRRWVLAVAATMALFYVHLLAAAVWVLVILCVECSTLLRALVHPLHALRARAGSSLGAAGVFAVLLLASRAGEDSLPRGDGSNLWYPGHGELLPTLLWKGGIFVRMFADHASPWITALTLVGLGALVLGAVVGGQARPRGAAALAAGALLAAVLVLPESAGTGSLLDNRMALPLLAVAAAATPLEWAGRRARLVGLALLACVVVARSAALSLAFADEAGVYRAFDDAARTLPPGSILLTARGRTDADIGAQAWWSPPMEHVGARAAYAAVFVPTVFAVASQQPVVLRPEFARWRREWRIATDAELAEMRADIAPLCNAAHQPGGRPVFLFVAYPRHGLSAAFAPSALRAHTPEFRLFDACAVAPQAS